MNFKIKLSPQIIRGYSKENVLSRIKGCKTFGTYGDYLFEFSQGEEKITVYNLTKQNKKSKQVKNKNGKTIKSTVVKQKEWVAYVYKIPISLLKLTNSKVSQKTRNFVISKI